MPDNDIQKYIDDLIAEDKKNNSELDPKSETPADLNSDSVEDVFLDDAKKEEQDNEMEQKNRDEKEKLINESKDNFTEDTTDNEPDIDQNNTMRKNSLNDGNISGDDKNDQQGYSDSSEKRPQPENRADLDLGQKIDDLYGGSYANGNNEAVSDASRIKLASEEKQQALKDKMDSIKLGRIEAEIRSKAAAAGLGYIKLKGLPIIPSALKIIPEQESRENKIICFMFKQGVEARIAVVQYSPKVEEIIDRIRKENNNIQIRIYLTSDDSISYAIKMYKSLPAVEKNIDDVKILEKDLSEDKYGPDSLKQLEAEIKQASTTEILSLIISTAIKAEASDIHIEAEKSGIQLRYRIDGVLHDIARIDSSLWNKIISRIKLDSKLKINIDDKPQDGNFSIHIKGQEIDFRVSTLPTNYGESVVMRILYHNKVKSFTLDKLGIRTDDEKILLSELKKPNGMMVVTGPTGSGKTTTLYAILNKINTEDNKIITIEDPIEYKIEGINQSQVNPSKNYTFTKGLRSIVRQDPDVILIGEIRDQETTDIALNASLTGHLVFTTLHTNDAAGAITRFLALEAKPYLLAPAINISIAQRLIRRLCPYCKEKTNLNQEQEQRLKQEISLIPDVVKNKLGFDINQAVFYEAKGCPKCSGIGYKGQIGIFEFFRITEEVKELILSGQISDAKLSQIAANNNMVTMAQDGVIKAAQGVTTLDEIFRVV